MNTYQVLFISHKIRWSDEVYVIINDVHRVICITVVKKFKRISQCNVVFTKSCFMDMNCLVLFFWSCYCCDLLLKWLVVCNFCMEVLFNGAELVKNTSYI